MTTGSGALYVVATPIGNLEDLTLRALRILREVDLIAAEDTRRTARLLARYDVHKPLVSLREHNERRETPRLLQKLASGHQIALVSDAGTPAIADPGARLVRAARHAGVRIVPVPGPSAVTAALSVAGLPNSEFAFMGFPPSGGVARRTWFERLASEERAVVLFEAPHRIRRTLVDLRETLGNRPIVVAREMSKAHEQYVVQPIDELSEFGLTARGEFTLVVYPPEHPPGRRSADNINAELIGRLTDSGLFTSAELESVVAGMTGAPPNVARKIIRKRRFLVKK